MNRLATLVLAALGAAPGECDTTTTDEVFDVPDPDCAVVGNACFCDKDEEQAPTEQLVLNCPRSMNCCYLPADVACACVAPSDYGHATCSRLLASYASAGSAVTRVENCVGY